MNMSINITNKLFGKFVIKFIKVYKKYEDVFGN